MNGWYIDMAGAAVKVIGDKAIVRTLTNLAHEIEKPTTFYDDWGMIMLQSVDKNFKQQGRPQRWKALSETTLKMRRKGKKKKEGSAATHKILQDTGRLKTSIQYVAESQRLLVGTNMIYAATHQYGRADNKMFGKALAPIPARPFLMVHNEDRDKMRRFALQRLERVAKGR